jgi:hypothetical protein
MKLEERYRGYLIGKLRAEDSSTGRIIVGDSEMANWILPLLPAGVICWAFSLTGLASLPVLIPAGAIALAGMCYVLWVRIKYVTEWRKSLPQQDSHGRDKA